jgi:hypothetical protein
MYVNTNSGLVVCISKLRPYNTNNLTFDNLPNHATIGNDQNVTPHVMCIARW